MISAVAVVNRIIHMLGEQIESVTLAKRSSGDGATTSTTWLAHVGPPMDGTSSIMSSTIVGSKHRTVEMYKVEQTVEPQEEDSVTIADGTVLRILSVRQKIDRHVFQCTCLENK